MPKAEPDVVVKYLSSFIVQKWGHGDDYANGREGFNSFLNHDSDGYGKASLVSFAALAAIAVEWISPSRWALHAGHARVQHQEGEGKRKRIELQKCTLLFFFVEK